MGASGVGKTQILKAILALKEISNGGSINGIKWRVGFEAVIEQNYVWPGEFENKGLRVFFDEDNQETKNISLK